MRTIVILPCVALLAAAAPAFAQSGPSQLAAVVQNSSAPAVTDAKPAAPTATAKKVCKNLPASHTRRTERVCLTKDEWARVEEEAR